MSGVGGVLDGRSTFELSIPGARQEWATRVERMCRVMESYLRAADALLWSRSQKDCVPDQLLTERGSLFRKLERSSTRWFSLHNGRDSYVDRNGTLVDHGQVVVGGRFNDLSRQIYSLTVSFPSEQCTDVASLLTTLADEGDAIWGSHSPEVTRVALRAGHFMQNWECAIQQGAVELVTDLPRLALLEHGARPQSPLQPEVLGWLNYWSSQTCEWLGLGDSQIDLSKPDDWHRTPGGACLIRVTDEPLDLRRQAHVEALLEAYSRFPKVGVRVP